MIWDIYDHEHIAIHIMCKQSINYAWPIVSEGLVNHTTVGTYACDGRLCLPAAVYVVLDTHTTGTIACLTIMRSSV